MKTRAVEQVQQLPELRELVEQMDRLVPGEGAGSETPFELCEIDEGVERLPSPIPTLGPLGQLLAALVAVGVVGLILVGAAALLGWLLR